MTIIYTQTGSIENHMYSILSRYFPVVMRELRMDPTRPQWVQFEGVGYRLIAN